MSHTERELNWFGQFVEKLLRASENNEVRSREIGHSHLGVVFCSLRRKAAPSSMYVRNFKLIGVFVEKLLREFQIVLRQRLPAFVGVQNGEYLMTCRRSVPASTEQVWLRLMHVISKYRGNRDNWPAHQPGHRWQTHKQTDGTHYNTLRR